MGKSFKCLIDCLRDLIDITGGEFHEPSVGKEQDKQEIHNKPGVPRCIRQNLQETNELGTSHSSGNPGAPPSNAAQRARRGTVRKSKRTRVLTVSWTEGVISAKPRVSLLKKI